MNLQVYVFVCVSNNSREKIETGDEREGIEAHYISRVCREEPTTLEYLYAAITNLE